MVVSRFRTLITIGGCLVALSCAGTPTPDRPNFVFFLVDDLGWRDLGCYGSNFYDTPNIDRLAAQGARFTNAYAACPVCSPTRASILTGKYPARVGITNWIPGRREALLRPPEYLHQLPLEEVTLAEALREAGYATGFVGKWHLGDRPYYPEDQGFDINIAGNANGYPPTYFHPYRKGDYALDLPGGKEGEYLTDRLTDEAGRFIRENRDRPFLLYFSYYTVHNPQEAKPELVEKYRARREALPLSAGPRYLPEGPRETRQVQDDPVYAAMVQSLDESVGRVTRLLEDLGLEERTVLIFTSDNGGLSTSEGSPTSNVPLRAGKGWLYEGGIREPLIVKWPGSVEPGTLSGQAVISTDFFPTLLEIAGLSQRPDQHVDGTSLVPVLRGTGRLPDRELYWHYPHYGNQGGTPGGAVRAGDFKLIEFYEDGRLELYNLGVDPGEAVNLVELVPDKASELREKLHGWKDQVEARMPTPNPDFDPAVEESFHRRQREISRK